jgi:aminoglycoside 3-N-acetyltransferase
MSKTHVTPSELVAGLHDLGVQAGDLLFVHASLSRFGHVEGGARALIEALLEAIGPGGTLAMPGFTFNLYSLPRPVFNVRHSPCWASKVYELFRVQVATHRSHHVTHSVCATGRLAAELSADHGPAPCGATSPFRKLARRGGKIVLLGVSHNNNTTFHAVEEQERLAYFSLRENPHATLIDESGQRRPLPALLHASTRRYDFNRLNASLQQAGLQREAFIGDSLVRCLDAGGMFDHLVQAVRRDPEALLWQGEGRLQIPVGRMAGQTVYG